MEIQVRRTFLWLGEALLSFYFMHWFFLYLIVAVSSDIYNTYHISYSIFSCSHEKLRPLFLVYSWKMAIKVTTKTNIFVKNGYKSNNKDQYFCHVATAQCFPERYIYIYGVMSHFQHFSFLVYGVLFQHSFCCSGCPCGIEVTPCVSASYLWEIKCSS